MRILRFPGEKHENLTHISADADLKIKFFKVTPFSGQQQETSVDKNRKNPNIYLFPHKIHVWLRTFDTWIFRVITRRVMMVFSTMNLTNAKLFGNFISKPI
jgi:hypothetical protein